MPTAVIKDGVVINMIVAGPDFTIPDRTLIESDVASIGYTYDGETFAPPITPLADQKSALASAVDTIRDEHLFGGFTVPERISVALGGRVLQTRDERDRTAWLTSQAAYQSAVIAGAGTVEGAAIRPEDNLTTVVSYSEGLAIMLAMAAWGSSVYERSWSLKDEIATAEDSAALAVIGVNAGWP